MSDAPAAPLLTPVQERTLALLRRDPEPVEFDRDFVADLAGRMRAATDEFSEALGGAKVFVSKAWVTRALGCETHFLAPDEFRLIDDQYLDVSDAVRQYEETGVPISPICREACAGLCPVCGKNRNRDACDCAPEAETVPAWSGLAALAERLRSEETERSDGRSEA